MATPCAAGNHVSSTLPMSKLLKIWQKFCRPPTTMSSPREFPGMAAAHIVLLVICLLQRYMTVIIMLSATSKRYGNFKAGDFRSLVRKNMGGSGKIPYAGRINTEEQSEKAY